MSGKLRLFGALILGLLASRVEAATLHRLPLQFQSPPYPINYWKDDSGSATDGRTIRYDGFDLSHTRPYDGHRGTDFGAPYGTVVYASAPGRVVYTNNTCAPNGGSPTNTCGSGFGNWVAIQHADGLDSIYAHLSSVGVANGATIHCLSGPGGTIIGYSGNSGQSYGAHLHFELRAGTSASASSYDPFAGIKSQSLEYWYRYALIPDPVRSGYYIHYPATTCQSY